LSSLDRRRAALASALAIVLALAGLSAARALEPGPALGPRIASLQRRLERDFLRAGSVTSIRYESASSDRVVDVEEYGDSALWTGVYLASQCLRHAASEDPGEQAAALEQVRRALGAIETLFAVTGTRGLLARFAIDPAAKALEGLRVVSHADPSRNPGWKRSGPKPGWLWIGGTSRDQYTGILFGLGICDQLVDDPFVQAVAGPRIVSTVRALRENGWKIPAEYERRVTAHRITAVARASWLQLAALADPEDTGLEREYREQMAKVRSSWLEALNPTVYNNYLEYYGWNLSYLRYYTLLAFEQDEETAAFLRERFLGKSWKRTWDHRNSMFTFMKLGLLGVTDADRDQQALEEALESLDQLVGRDRRSFFVRNSERRDLRKSRLMGFAHRTVTLFGLVKPGGFLRKVDPNLSRAPLPLRERASTDFFWQRSPFQMDGGGDGSIASPAVDSLIAYWLGRFHGLLSPEG
jgi:hypothetical protein